MAVDFCKRRNRVIRFGIIPALFGSLLTACGWLSDFNRRLVNDEDEDWRIAALEDFSERLKLKKVWSQSIGDARGTTLRRQLLLQGNVVFGCGPDGNVFAFSARDGKRLWSREFDTETSFCIGGSGQALMIGAITGEVIAFSVKNGNQLWRTRLRGGAISAISKVRNGKVLVRSAKGNITALSARNGKTQWQIKEKLPSLTLRGMSVPVLYEQQALVGLDDGRLVILSFEDGRVLREIRVGLIKEGDDLDRIVDIDGKIEVRDGIFYVTSYQGRTIAFDLQRNSILWFAEVSSYQGVALGKDHVYLVNSNGELLKLDRYVGSEVWTNAAFSIRDLTVPLALGQWIVVGSDDGYLYWIDAEDGKIVARFNSRDEIVSPPLRFGNQVIAVDRDGDLFAVKITARLIATKN